MTAIPDGRPEIPHSSSYPHEPARRELPIKPDYTGKTIDDRFVVSYGLDSEERGRNYRDIFNYAM